MAIESVPNQNPRRMPRQRRSSVTVEIILEATLQILLRTGTSELTTTLVAERAGVSVGSLYQYFPNKQALFFAVNERYLDRLAARIEEVCLALHGAPYAAMAEGVISEYIKIKMERYELTHALYHAAEDIDVSEIVETICQRVEAASQAMFATASDATFQDLPALNMTLMNVLFGTVRTFFDRNSPELLNRQLQEQLIILFCTSLRSGRRTL